MTSRQFILGVLAFTGIVRFLRRGKKTTQVDASGVLFRRPPARPLFVPWSEIEAFGIAQVGLIECGFYHSGGPQRLGVRLVHASTQRESKACRDNRLLSDYDLLFSPDSGRSLEDFLTYLELERSKYQG